METDREWIGVGTPLVRCPPHRSELAEVPYAARTSGNGARAESLRVAGDKLRQVSRDIISSVRPTFSCVC